MTPIRLREQVKRNRDRFPSDFMFQLTQKETGSLVSQNAIPSWKYLGGYLPYVFTQEGVAMLSSVLRSKRAVRANIAIMRAFVKLGYALATNTDLARKLETLERRISKNEVDIQAVAKFIHDCLQPKKEKPYPKIGFHPPEKERN